MASAPPCGGGGRYRGRAPADGPVEGGPGGCARSSRGSRALTREVRSRARELVFLPTGPPPGHMHAGGPGRGRGRG